MATKRRVILAAIPGIIAQYDTKITLRQLYYRLVSKFAGTDVFENEQKNYKFLSKLLVDARHSGEISFDAIEDRTRGILAGEARYETAETYFNKYLRYLKECADDYRIPLWLQQPYYIEVWIEKQALTGVFQSICVQHGVVLSVVRGYPSLTMLKDAADRFSEQEEKGKTIAMLYFGDMDPSGQDIPRYIQETLEKHFHCTFEQIMCAITKEQIKEYKIPPMPAKRSDTRFDKFAREHGEDAVELDALDPDILQEIITDNIEVYFDDNTYEKVKTTKENPGRKQIGKLLEKALKKDAPNERKK